MLFHLINKYVNLFHKYCRYLFSEDKYFKNIADKLRKIDAILDKKINSLKFYTDKTSHILNKSEIFICYHDDEGKIYTENNLIFIMISLLAHALSISVGHTPEYYSIRDDLVAKATLNGIYDKRRDFESFIPKIIFKVIKKKYLQEEIRYRLETRHNESYYAPDGLGAQALFDKYRDGIKMKN